MIQAWNTIDRQVELLGLPKLPYDYQYRFTNSGRILLQ